MEKTGKRNFAIAQLLSMAVMLLLIPFSTLAAGTGLSLQTPSLHEVLADHHTNILPDTSEVHGTPAEAPLHCHLRKPHPQESGPAQVMVKDDLPLSASQFIAPFLLGTKKLRSSSWAAIPIPELSRFILFGNFRS